MNIRIATRTSRLAMVQTEQIIAALKQQLPDLTATLIEVVTMGDQIQDRSLATLGGKGLFIKGLEHKLLSNDADLAMHSLKDVPPQLEPAFCIPAVLKRHAPNDAFVSKNYQSIADLPKGAIVGTSSVRRQAALLHLRPDLKVAMIRGNVDTRLKKLDQGQYDGLILAEAGLRRLGLEDQIKEVLSIECFPPSVGQGIIAMECLTSRQDMIDLLSKANDIATYIRMTAERAMNSALNASCTSPIGSYATIDHEGLHLLGVIWHPDGSQRIETRQTGSLDQPEILGQRAAKALLDKGAATLLAACEC